VLREVERSAPVLAAHGDDRRLAKAWRLAAAAYGVSYRFGDAAAAAHRSAEHAGRAGDTRAQSAMASAYAMAALYGPTPVGEAIARCEAALAQTASNRRVHGFVMLLKAPLHAMQGEFETARILCRDASAALHEIGAKLYAARTSLESSVVDLLAGDVEAAERALRRDYETLEAMGERYLRPTVAASLARVLCRLDRLDEATELAAVAEELSADDDLEAQALWRLAAASVLIRRGQAEAARPVAKTAVELFGRTDALVRLADAMEVAAEASLVAGEEQEAAVALERAAALYARKGNLVAERAARDRLTGLVAGGTPVT
jgi:ATP/maltotriose-dependent transcriptional regulator MalT